MKFNIHDEIKYVPLPAHKEPMWEEAMGILIQWILEIDEFGVLNKEMEPQDEPFQKVPKRDVAK
jgi:hypothetical protein